MSAIINKSYVDTVFVFLQKMYNSYAHITVPSFVITLFPVIVIGIKFIFSLMLLHPIFTHVPTRMIKLPNPQPMYHSYLLTSTPFPKNTIGLRALVLHVTFSKIFRLLDLSLVLTFICLCFINLQRSTLINSDNFIYSNSL